MAKKMQNVQQQKEECLWDENGNMRYTYIQDHIYSPRTIFFLFTFSINEDFKLSRFTLQNILFFVCKSARTLLLLFSLHMILNSWTWSESGSATLPWLCHACSTSKSEAVGQFLLWLDIKWPADGLWGHMACETPMVSYFICATPLTVPQKINLVGKVFTRWTCDKNVANKQMGRRKSSIWCVRLQQTGEIKEAANAAWTRPGKVTRRDKGETNDDKCGVGPNKLSRKSFKTKRGNALRRQRQRWCKNREKLDLHPPSWQMA